MFAYLADCVDEEPSRLRVTPSTRELIVLRGNSEFCGSVGRDNSRAKKQNWEGPGGLAGGGSSFVSNDLNGAGRDWIALMGLRVQDHSKR